MSVDQEVLEQTELSVHSTDHLANRVEDVVRHHIKRLLLVVGCHIEYRTDPDGSFTAGKRSFDDLILPQDTSSHRIDDLDVLILLVKGGIVWNHTILHQIFDELADLVDPLRLEASHESRVTKGYLLSLPRDGGDVLESLVVWHLDLLWQLDLLVSSGSFLDLVPLVLCETDSSAYNVGGSEVSQASQDDGVRSVW